jgi:hypothetical protein
MGLDRSVLDAAVAPPPAKSSETLAFNGLTIIDSNANSRNTFKSNENGLGFGVYVSNLAPDKAHTNDVELVLKSPDGKEYGRLGGQIRVQPGDECADNVLPLADPQHANGFQIANSDLSTPGTYTVSLELDGKAVSTRKFQIVAPDVGNGKLGLVQCYVGDDKGTPCSAFTQQDTGAFVFLFLSNKDRSEPHEHSVLVTVTDVNGKALSQPMGGTLQVKAGEDLSKRELPGDIDAHGTNGVLIKDNQIPSGEYQFRVSIDGQEAKILPFTIGAKASSPTPSPSPGMAPSPAPDATNSPLPSASPAGPAPSGE